MLVLQRYQVPVLKWPFRRLLLFHVMEEWRRWPSCAQLLQALQQSPLQR